MNGRGGSPAAWLGLSPTQTLLLKASLLTGDPALAAWQGWREAADIEVLEPGAYSLMPCLYRNLVALGVDDPLVSILKGVYKRTWLVNQMACKRLGRIVEAFAAKGLAALPLGGLAALLTVYQDLGLRPLGRMVLAVRPSQLRAAAETAQELGWQLLNQIPVNLHYGGSLYFKMREDPGLELRWRWLPHVFQQEPCRPLWQDAVPLDFQGMRLRVMQPDDALFLALADGGWRQDREPLAWLADAFHMLQKGSIDWERVLARAQALRSANALRPPLEGLRELLAAPVPDAVMQRLAALSSRPWDKIYHQAYGAPAVALGDERGFREVFLGKVRLHRNRPLWFVLLTALRQYARNLWAPARQGR